MSKNHTLIKKQIPANYSKFGAPFKIQEKEWKFRQTRLDWKNGMFELFPPITDRDRKSQILNISIDGRSSLPELPYNDSLKMIVLKIIPISN